MFTISTPHTTEFVAIRDLDGSVYAVNQYFAEIHNLDVIGEPAPTRHMALMDCQEWEYANRYCCNPQRIVSPMWIDFANRHFIDTDFDEMDSYYEDYIA